MFREDLPGIIHRLSQQWVNAKVEAPYLSKFPPSPHSPEPVTTVMSAPDLRTLHRPNARPPSVAHAIAGMRPFYPRGRTSSGPSIAPTTQSRTRRPKSPEPTHPPDPPDSTFPEIENFDPTYGLRPEGLPTKSAFRSFGRLFSKPGRGLADLAEECTDEDDDAVGDESTSYDIADWDDPPSFTPSDPSVLGDNPAGTSAGIEYETVPAVGGGTVTRPRVFHAHSQVHPRTPLYASLASTSRLTQAAVEQLPRADLPRRPHSLFNPYLPPLDVTDQFARAPSMRTYRHYRDPSEAPTPPLYHSPPRRAVSPSSLHTHESSSHTQTQSVPTPRSTEALLPPPRERTRRGSTTSMSVTGTDTTDARIVLRPALHGALSALATLEHSNHTLSPYTRSPSHFTVRSGPRSAPPAPPHHAPPRARRRRTHFLGAAAAAKAKATKAAREEEEEVVVVEGCWEEDEGGARSEFDAEDMDRYFRMRDELASAGAGSEPTRPDASSSSLRYGIRHGYGYGWAPPPHSSFHHHRDRLPEGVDAYALSRRRRAYSQRE
jgi:distribution and morphology protein 34